MKLLFASLVVGAILSACKEAPVVLASFDEIDAGPGRPMPARCIANSDCAPGSYCERRHCEDTTGECHHFPIACADEESPTCGCDGVTYWNDCLRRTAGVSTAEIGQCSYPLTCSDGVDCPSGAACARLVGADPTFCRPNVEGTCWVLPVTCPEVASVDRWSVCDANDTKTRCIDTCTAIRSGKPYRRELHCE
jgi:hypothetical protein